MIRATTKILLFKNRPLKNGAFPVVLQIVFQGKPKRFALGKNLWSFEKDWDAAAGCYLKTAEDWRQKNALLDGIRAKSNSVLYDIDRSGIPFTFEAYEQKLFGKEIHKAIPIGQFIEELVTEMKAQNRLGNARVYHECNSAVNSFRKTSKIMFPDVNYNFLKNFELHLFNRGCSGGGAQIYMRTLRAIYNEAIRRGIVSKELYPFKSQLNPGGYALSNLKSKASPRALSMEDMQRVKDFDVDQHPHLNLAYKVFMFSYYVFGVNFGDIIQLKQSDVYNGRIEFNRAKTGKHFSIAITPAIQTILDEFRMDGNPYLFPVLSAFHCTPQQIADRKKKVLKQINAGLKEIAGLLDIEAHLTTYVARHTFATTLKEKGVNVATISECLGHADMSTTKAYLRKFEQSKLDEVANLL